MGCDIHLYLEKRNKYGKWENSEFTKEEFYGGRCYPLFARLANVRNLWNLEHLPLRGFPINASTEVKKAFLCKIVSDAKYDQMIDDCPMNIIKKTRSIEILEDSDYKYIKPYLIEDNGDLLQLDKDYILYMLNNDKVSLGKLYITHPDFHSANCCTYEEMRQCVQETVKEEYYESERWFNLLSKMEEYTKEGDCRAIFWFDN
jgi:hypothetical protein